MPLKPGYLLLVGAGGIVAYSGIRGKGIGSAIRDVLSGHSPKDALQINGISGTPTGNTGGGNFKGGVGKFLFTGANASEKSYFSAVLRDLGAPVTQANLNTMYQWARQEEPSFPPPNAWNPLNIKSVVTGGFAQWSSPAQGASGTAQFMVQNNYGSIVAALRSGRGLIGSQDPNVAAELSLWSGGGYSSIG